MTDPYAKAASALLSDMFHRLGLASLLPHNPNETSNTMDIFNLYTTIALTTSTADLFADRNAADHPPGTIFEDRDGAKAMVSADQKLIPLTSGVATGKTVWYDAKLVNADGSDVTPKPSTDGLEHFGETYLDYADKVGQVFQTEDGRTWLNVWALGLYDDEDQRVHAVGLSDRNAKLFDDYVRIRMLRTNDNVTLQPQSTTSSSIRARSGC